jgi:2-methylisocitrate lyase-like PEP mutase family enzyme
VARDVQGEWRDRGAARWLAFASMPSQTEKAARFLALHHGPAVLLLPNPWDAGSARLLGSLGFDALATTSSGFAATVGRADGQVTREEAIAHARVIVDATDLPVSADLENGFADAPDAIVETIVAALDAGLAGCSIEDATGREKDPIYPLDLATERIAAAAERAHAGPVHLVLTARAEQYLHGRPDLDETIIRLQAYARAGADVLYAPGLVDIADIALVVESVDRPLNVLALAGSPPVAALATVGVARVSVGGSFAFAALGAVVEAAHEFKSSGTYGFTRLARLGRQAAPFAH